MKNSTKALGGILLLTIALLSGGCQSSNQKIKNAEDNVQEAIKDLEDSKRDLHEIRLDTISNYEQFKIEAEKLIATQEKNIVDLKAKIAKEKEGLKQDYEEKLITLESKNNELKKKLAEYKDEGQDKWNGFKKEFNHDMNELGKAFKGLTVNDSR
ncbi:hypothetical protein [Carboxylicivirga taeanensis]|uniref:hypothetical protein n=1 Tax=Carboxylicivirga taeanensis TaxID=1416875 RepID=UPI003F6E1871